MRSTFAFLVGLGCGLLASPSHAQDIELRREAVRLLERANEVSLSPKLPDLERRVVFRVLSPTGPPQEGTFERYVIQGVGRREVYSFGDYQHENVFTGDTLITTQAQRQLMPPPLAHVIRLTPIYLVTFDENDVIRGIRNDAVRGRPARCIEFDTIAGEKRRHNEICLDAESGVMLFARLNDAEYEYSDFFSFAGALLPARITYSHSGTRWLEISQSMAELKDKENALAAPPGSVRLQSCTTYRRAIAQQMPQPKPGEGSHDVEILISAIINSDGRIHQAAILTSHRPDLHAEALAVARQWEFSPALCNGQPNPAQVAITIRFRNR